MPISLDFPHRRASQKCHVKKQVTSYRAYPDSKHASKRCSKLISVDIRTVVEEAPLLIVRLWLSKVSADRLIGFPYKGGTDFVVEGCLIRCVEWSTVFVWDVIKVYRKRHHGLDRATDIKKASPVARRCPLLNRNLRLRSSSTRRLRNLLTSPRTA